MGFKKRIASGVGACLLSLSLLSGTPAHGWTCSVPSVVQIEYYNSQFTGLSTSVPDGIYAIKAKCGKVLDIDGSKKDAGVNVLLWPLHAHNNQRFRIKCVNKKTGAYTIQSVATGKYLDVAGISRASGANIYQWSYTGAANQLWYFEPSPSGYARIRSGMGTYVDVQGNGTANGTNIWAYAGNTTDAQKFTLIRF